MSDDTYELYSSSKRVKAIITRCSPQALSVQIFVLNEGVISGQGPVHAPVWERVTSTLYADSLERASALAEREFRRFPSA